MTQSDRPIFVVGFQRSGTTLLQALLGAHPRIAAPPETYYVARVADHADYFGNLADDANLARALHEALNPPLDYLADCGFDEPRLLARAKAGPRTYAGLLDAMLSDFAERNGKARWAEKSAGQRIGPIVEMFPAAKVVHIVRDPRDAVASSLATAWTDPDAAALARGWRSFVLDTIQLGAAAGPAHFLQIRYEDLSRDPDTVMRMVCTFLDERFDPGMVADRDRRRSTVPRVASAWQGRALAAVQPACGGGWRRRLSPLDQLRVHAIVAPLLVPLGYEPPGFAAAMASRPLALLELARRLATALRPRRRMSAEARYRLKRSYVESQAARVLDAGAAAGDW